MLLHQIPLSWQVCTGIAMRFQKQKKSCDFTKKYFNNNYQTEFWSVFIKFSNSGKIWALDLPIFVLLKNISTVLDSTCQGLSETGECSNKKVIHIFNLMGVTIDQKSEQDLAHFSLFLGYFLFFRFDFLISFLIPCAHSKAVKHRRALDGFLSFYSS